MKNAGAMAGVHRGVGDQAAPWQFLNFLPEPQ